MTELDMEQSAATSLLARCLSLDLEVGKQDARIHQFAAVRGDSGQAYHFTNGALGRALTELDSFSAGSELLLGHNLIAFDAPILSAADPELQILRLPRLDTLRLNPLAFPRNPYHHLVKHYQDGLLLRGRLNDPELDARLTLQVLADQFQALRNEAAIDPRRVLAWHWLTTLHPADRGFDAFFGAVRRQPRPSDAEAVLALEYLLGDCCQSQIRDLVAEAETQGWPLAYALAWLSVAEGNSVMPPWVRHQFPEAGEIVRRLRDMPCVEPTCRWCRERHDSSKELRHWFGFEDFRPEPQGQDGRPLQQAIVEAAMQGRHVLGILPTGTGKSLCYQIPALSRNDKTGALTIVISPLAALMADQVTGMQSKGITACAALNGLLTMPERAEVLDRVRLGDIGILIISPEQLRNRSLRKVLEQREIGAWVLDEAHCLSKWGHDFRPDYRYVARFIREKASGGRIAPVLCLTATAKPDVKADILSYFRDKLDISLELYDGGAQRTNLEFVVVPTSPAEKLAHVFGVLMADLPPDMPGGAIVYCSTRKGTEEMSAFLSHKGLAAAHFHAGLKPETKKSVQERFIQGELRVIAATNAFGMGIDKPDVRLVVHADIPGSLENYLQEAGRAGRDREAARCVLLYAQEDVERQFGMSARSRLTQREIQSILRALRALDRKKRLDGEVVATSGEILAEEEDGIFERDDLTEDTRVRTAISWLEESALLTREENRVQVFPSSLRVSSLEEAAAKLAKCKIRDSYRKQLLSIVEALLNASVDEGITTDELMGKSGLSPEQVRMALHDLERLGLASNDTALTAFVHAGVERSSLNRFMALGSLEEDLLSAVREADPDVGTGSSSLLRLRQASQRMRDQGHAQALPEVIRRLVQGIAADGRSDEGGLGNLRVRRLDAETDEIHLQRAWSTILETARVRRDAAKHLLDHLLMCVPDGTRGTDLLVETTLGRLAEAIERDFVLCSKVKDARKLMERALMWLHEQEIIRLNRGMTIFRSAMTIKLAPERRGFVRADFAPLQTHYDEQTTQIHVMAAYVQQGLQRMADALRLAMDYFGLSREEFVARWMPDRKPDELTRQTTPESWRAIVDSLANPVQQRIVTDDREQTNVLVLAGPGSGKTRVLVHRIAYLIRVRRESPRGILALAYNRHAAVEIRRRLVELIGDDARGVSVLTCHALAMRLAGVSFEKGMEEKGRFREVLLQAIALLKGEGLADEEANEQREHLLRGFRWILVDEYQDISPEQYELISALAGRTLNEEEGKLTLFAVGDDDQNIYAFEGASVEFIRRFEADYAAKPAFLTENYRSTANIVAASNLLIEPATARMKVGHPIAVNRARSRAPAGGTWQGLDPVSRGRVQILPVGRTRESQTVAVMTELQRLGSLDPTWSWDRCAVIARTWTFLDPVRAYCEETGIPVQVANEDELAFWRLRETQALVSWLSSQRSSLVVPSTVLTWLATQPPGPWNDLLRAGLEAYDLETSGAELPAAYAIEWLADWGRELRRRQSGLLLLTAHRAKGLEFDHVVVLDGAWDRLSQNEDPDAPRRLYYVAMTRARQTLTLARSEVGHRLLDALPASPALLRREPAPIPAPSDGMLRLYQRLSPRDVDLGFAGRHQPDHSVHRAIASLEAGDPILFDLACRKLRTLDGTVVGSLAKAYEPPAGHACVAARVHAIITRHRDASETAYAASVRSDTWEIILPELVFAPNR